MVNDNILKEFCVTEKAAEMSSMQNKYTFKVATNANRIEIAKAVEKAFDVTVTAVNILHRRGKQKRNRTRAGHGMTSASKRAVVTLKDGDKIEIV